MNKTTKKLLIISILLIVIKLILSLFVSTPTIYSDEYLYMKMAQSFFQNLNLNIHNIQTSNYHPLYPIILSITYFTNNVQVAYILMKLLNAILSTLIIIPAYLFSKEFLDAKKSIITATIISILPMNFVFPSFIMAENIFYSLFLTSLYLIYKSFTEKNYKYDLLAGISIGLTFLSRFAAVSLIAIVIILLIYKIIKKDFFEIKKKTIIGITSLVIVSPWLIRNAINFGFTLRGLLGQYSIEITKQVNNYSLNIFYWILLYSAYFLLASFIIITIFAFSNIKEKLKDKKMKIFTIMAIITIIIIIIGAAQHAAKSALKEETDLPGLIGRPIGRYADTALPILYLLGIISYYKYTKDKKSAKIIFLVSIPLILLSSQLLYFKLVPINNTTLTLLGVINLSLLKTLNQTYSIILTTLLILATTTLIYFLYKKSKIKPLKLIVSILIITNLLAYSAIIYNSKTNWENHPQIELSKWISKNIDKKSRILIDEDYCDFFDKTKKEVLCTKGKSTTLTALWILNPVNINSIDNEADYIITRKKLNLELIKETSNGIYLYKK